LISLDPGVDGLKRLLPTPKLFDWLDISLHIRVRPTRKDYPNG